MYLYRAKEIGSKDRLNGICLKIIDRGDYDQILAILPHIRILRSEDFFNPLIKLLDEGETDQKTAAALALGCLGDSRCIPFLCDVYNTIGSNRRYANQSLRAAIVEALGELATEESVKAIVSLSSPVESNSDDTEYILSALGQLAQQGISGAEDQLIAIMRSGGGPKLTSLSITEILVAYWHRPNEISDDLLEKISEIAANGSKEVVRSVVASLSSLVQLGSEKARTHLLAIEEKTSKR